MEEGKRRRNRRRGRGRRMWRRRKKTGGGRGGGNEIEEQQQEEEKVSSELPVRMLDAAPHAVTQLTLTGESDRPSVTFDLQLHLHFNLIHPSVPAESVFVPACACALTLQSSSLAVLALEEAEVKGRWT